MAFDKMGMEILWIFKAESSQRATCVTYYASTLRCR
jgi:hypothetical protein